MDRQAERVFTGKMGPVLRTTASQKSLFEHVSKRSLRFYHRAIVWTPPCSALLYSVCADAFQSDCSASFSLCMSVVSLSHYLACHAFTSTALLSFHFIHLSVTLKSLSHLPLSTSSVVLFVLPLHYENEGVK